jgi:hypothetical protein
MFGAAAQAKRLYSVSPTSPGDIWGISDGKTRSRGAEYRLA